jgi:hypothetical protein
MKNLDKIKFYKNSQIFNEKGIILGKNEILPLQFSEF